MAKEDDKIYYYTSNYVLLQWLKNEKIWATRSISSNDSSDTIYMIKHFDELKKIFSEEKYKIKGYNFSNEIEKARDLLLLSKNFSLRVYKDILKDFISNKFDVFTDIIKEVNSRYEFIKASRVPTKEGLKLNEIVPIFRFCKDGTVKFNCRELEKQEMLLDSILYRLSKNEIKKYFNVEKEVSKERLKELPTYIYPYVISFTYNEDDRFLWDCYTKNEGVCLEFSKEELEKNWRNRDLKYNKDRIMNIYLEDVRYDKEEQIQKLKSIIDVMYNDASYYNIGEALSFVSTICKSPYWKAENECRAVFGARYFSEERFQVKENYNLKYKNEYSTQDYIEIPFPRELVKGITVGPLCSKDELKVSVDTELDKEEYKEAKSWFDDMYEEGLVKDSKGYKVLKK